MYEQCCGSCKNFRPDGEDDPNWGRCAAPIPEVVGLCKDLDMRADRGTNCQCWAAKDGEDKGGRG